jgi:hypothetical protein
VPGDGGVWKFLNARQVGFGGVSPDLQLSPHCWRSPRRWRCVPCRFGAMFWVDRHWVKSEVGDGLVRCCSASRGGSSRSFARRAMVCGECLRLAMAGQEIHLPSRASSSERRRSASITGASTLDPRNRDPYSARKSCSKPVAPARVLDPGASILTSRGCKSPI